MPSVIIGDDYMLWVESSTPGTSNMIKGQGTLTINRSQAKIPTSSKDSRNYMTNRYGAQDVSISLDLHVKLPDANGYTRLETLANSRTPFKIEVRKNGAAGLTADAVFAATVNASITSVSFPEGGGVVDAKVEAVLESDPTVDTLA